MMKTIRKTAIVMLLFVYFLTYGVLPQVLAAGKDTPMIVVAHRAGAKVAPENTLAALEQAVRDGAPIAECVGYRGRRAFYTGSGKYIFCSIQRRTDPDTGRDACLCRGPDHINDRIKILRAGAGTGGECPCAASGV